MRTGQKVLVPAVCAGMNNESLIAGEVNSVQGVFVMILSPLDLRTCHTGVKKFFSL